MALPGGEHQHLLGYYGSFPVLILMGMFTGMFVVPVQVIIQSRPPRAEKGRMIATMNQCTWVGIILGIAALRHLHLGARPNRLAAKHDLRRHRRADAARGDSAIARRTSRCRKWRRSTNE